MPKGRSYASDNWQEFEKGNHTFVHDDFAHQKAFVFKGKLQNATNGVNIKQTINEKPEGLQQTGEVKFWFNFEDQRSLYAKVGTDTKVKIQLDNGVRELKQIKNNFYLGGEVNRTLTQKLVFGGIQLFEDKKWSVNTKVSHDYSKKITFLHNKLNFHWSDWKTNAFITTDITNRIFTKCGILVGWTPKSNNKWSYALSFQNSKKPEKLTIQSFFSKAVLNITNKWSQTQTVGIEAHVNVHSFKNLYSERYNIINSLWIGSQWKLSESTIKSRINKDLTTSITVKNKLSDYGYYSFGIEASEIGSKNRFKFGLQLDLNL